MLCFLSYILLLSLRCVFLLVGGRAAINASIQLFLSLFIHSSTAKSHYGYKRWSECCCHLWSSPIHVNVSSFVISKYSSSQCMSITYLPLIHCNFNEHQSVVFVVPSSGIWFKTHLYICPLIIKSPQKTIKFPLPWKKQLLLQMPRVLRLSQWIWSMLFRS